MSLEKINIEINQLTQSVSQLTSIVESLNIFIKQQNQINLELHNKIKSQNKTIDRLIEIMQMINRNNAND